MTKENPTPLDMARGYLAMHDKYVASPIVLDSAWFYLQKIGDKTPERFPLLVHYRFLRQDYTGIIAAVTKYKSEAPPDAWTCYRIGEAYFQTGDPAAALPWVEKAVTQLPLHLDFVEKKGVILFALKRNKEAKETFRQVLSENPDRPVALCNLGFAHALTGNQPEALRLYDQSIALDPDYEQALLNKAALLIFQKKTADGERLLRRVLKINPANAQAAAALQNLQ